RKVPVHIFGVLKKIKDQLLELHTNLTSVQAKLLQVLQSHWREGNIKETQQKEVQKQWNKFTVSLEETLYSISGNTSSLMTDLFSGLLRLQSFTRDSAKFVADELRTLEGDVKDVRHEIRQVQEDIDLVATGGVSRIEELAEMSLHRFSRVLPLGVCLR